MLSQSKGLTDIEACDDLSARTYGKSQIVSELLANIMPLAEMLPYSRKLALERWLFAHTRKVSRMDQVEGWLNTLSLAELLYEGTLLTTEISWHEYREDFYDKKNI